ncbi:MAG: ABC transporter permease [Ruminiclostridium sp.]|nr:ABC transporter permease [Ruminiclostridium sp.]
MKLGRDTYGWKNVFAFTFRQTAKSRAFKASSVIIIIAVFAMTLLAGILPGLIGSSSGSDGNIGGDTEITLKNIYLADTTGITSGADYEIIHDTYKVNVTDCGKDADITALTEKVKNEANSLLVTIEATDNGYDICASRPGDGSVSTDMANSFGELIKTYFDNIRLAKAGLSAEQIQAAFRTSAVYSSVAGEPTENQIGFIVKMIFPMLSSLILFMLIFIYGQMVAQSIAQEKTSKVMELLLTSVRPLAVIIGKILAMGSLALLQFLMIIASGVLGIAVSSPVSSMFVDSADATGVSANQIITEIGNALGGFSPAVIVLIIVVFIVGFIFFALIAGLIGATVSRMEDLNSAMQPMAIFGIIGFYLAYFPSSFDGEEGGFLKLLSYYLPISSPFSIPSALLTGAIDITQALVAVLVLCVFVVLMALLVARVYEQVILHTGNRLKMSDIIGLARNK